MGSTAGDESLARAGVEVDVGVVAGDLERDQVIAAGAIGVMQTGGAVEIARDGLAEYGRGTPGGRRAIDRRGREPNGLGDEAVGRAGAPL